MIIESVGLVAPPDKREELRRALSSLLEPTLAKSGCVHCRLYQETSNANALRFESHWKTQDDLMRHMRSDAYKELLLLLEMSAEPPSIEFYTVSEIRGLELLQETRRPHG